MDHRYLIILFCVLGAMPGATSGRAQAAPVTADATAISAPKSSLMRKTGEGCGWDYPCPPVPDFGRRFHRRDGDIYIHNNYGPVNVYVRGARAGESDRLPIGGPCETGGEDGVGCAQPRNCGGYPCDEKCGAWCWMRRFKKGYCGHGCWAYLEQSRVAAGERAERREERRQERLEQERLEEERKAREEYPPGCYYPECPPRRYEQPRREEARRWHEPPPYATPREDSLAPRKPFAGPRYRDTCTDGRC